MHTHTHTHARTHARAHARRSHTYRRTRTSTCTHAPFWAARTTSASGWYHGPRSNPPSPPAQHLRATQALPTGPSVAQQAYARAASRHLQGAAPVAHPCRIANLI
eukprot:11483380-Alexandrium_andersonii.AAC.1